MATPLYVILIIMNINPFLPGYVNYYARFEVLVATNNTGTVVSLDWAA
jgi:hypothetical protein